MPIPAVTLQPPPLSTSVSSDSRRSKPVTDGHIHRRIFVGPLPEKAIDFDQQKRKKRLFQRAASVDDDEEHISRIISENAFLFFLEHGGNEEDWGESQEQSVREEMLSRWRESEWGSIWRRRKQKKEPGQSKRWIGGSFEVGNILGVNILQEPAESIKDKLSSRSASSTRKLGASSSTHLPLTTPESPRANLLVPTTSFYAQDASGSTNAGFDSRTALLRPSGGTALDSRRTHSDVPIRPTLDMPGPAVKSDPQIAGAGKQHSHVHYADSPVREEPSPAPPSEVLERTASETQGTSAEATRTPTPHKNVPWGEIILRDRMLVRIGYTKTASIGTTFDEEQSRKTRGIRYDEWAEFMVIWRKDLIQFYEPHNVPGTKWLSGSKYRLAFIIPLKSTKTRFSLYSFVDLTFCITCPPTSTHHDSKARAIFRRAHEGTNIFICKLKCRSRAADWMWAIWRRLGGQLPPTLEIRNPSLGTRVRIDLPDTYSPEMFTRSNIIALCMRSLRAVKDWKELIELQLAEGKRMELAWRMGTQLDWVWLDTDVLDEPRASAVLCGLAMQQSSVAPQLEVRLGQHSPQNLMLRNGARLAEPPAVEGYLERIRPNTQTKHPMYLVTHDGNLFSLAVGDAYPPSPIGMGPTGDNYVETLRLTEVQRGTMQLMKATGVSDLRNIMAVRRAFQPVVPVSHDNPERADDQSYVDLASHIERSQSDDEDEGGEDGLRVAQDKSHLRMKRSFELLLKNGHVIRFEAHSRKVAVEWIERLQALVAYWKQRHRIDADEEMDLAQAQRPRLTPRRHVLQDDCELPPDPPADPSAPLPALGSLYSWCVLEGCKPVIRGGKVYVRRGLHGQYRFVQLFLVPGHLVQFRITPKSSLHLAMHKDINLADAYVTSGYFAALTLPSGQYTSDAAPRRYQDGLETDDPDEDTLFMLWYHPHRSAVNVGLEVPEGEERQQADSPRIPALSGKTKVVVFRTRSKLERDAWCWAINCEIEKIARVQKDREEILRNTGGSLG
ncbi:Pleckstrin homology domain-containing protein [Mycena rebaudengoi]|nr:Pleckstrin homology domain-containing protein [Mycena rebaudengoi]